MMTRDTHAARMMTLLTSSPGLNDDEIASELSIDENAGAIIPH